MAKFTRAEIRRIIGESCTDEMETALIALHHSIVDEVKDRLDEAQQYKADAEKLPEALKELDALKEGDFESKYAKEHEAFEAYKRQIADGEELNRKKAAYRQLLADEHINEKRLDAVIRLTDFSGMKLDKDGKLQDTDKLKADIKSEWSEYIATDGTRGAEVGTPPTAGKAVRSKADILAIKDTAERQQAIAENHQLFGF